MAFDRRNQRVVVEYSNGDWLVMHDSGEIEVKGTPEQALRAIQRRASRSNKGITITSIEWRNAPQGFEPPKGQQ